MTTASDFDVLYRALDAEFGALGELEPRSVLRDWMTAGDRSTPVRGVVARWFGFLATEGGELLGARDVYGVIDEATGAAVTFLSHTWVAPHARRSGWGTKLRRAAVGAVSSWVKGRGGRPPQTFAEMGHRDPNDVASSTRLDAYARAGFRAFDPAGLPYAQPDFSGGDRPVPLLAIVDGDAGDPQVATLALCVHRTWLPGAAIDAIVDHVRGARETPRTVDLNDPACLRVRAQPHYPATWWR